MTSEIHKIKMIGKLFIFELISLLFFVLEHRKVFRGCNRGKVKGKKKKERRGKEKME